MFIAYIEAPQFWLFSIFFVLLAYNSSNQVKNSNERDFVFVDEPKRIFIFNIKSMNKTADMTKFQCIYLHPFRFKKNKVEIDGLFNAKRSFVAAFLVDFS